MENFSNSGVYGIVNLKNGKLYVGSSTDLKRRQKDHLRALRGGYHSIPYLQNSWNKYGEENFSFIVLENCSPDQCVRVEQKWLDDLEPYKFASGYNRNPTAGSCLGFKHSQETKDKMSKSKMGVPMPKWVKERIKEALTGRVKSAEHRANLWKNRQGWKHSEESKKKIANSLLLASIEGRRSGPPEGWVHSEETKKKMSLARKGKHKTPEHRAKLSAAIKAALARKRESK